MALGLSGHKVCVVGPLDHHPGGFSLIELMVVIAIIAILSVAGTIQYLRYKSRAYFSRIKAVLEESQMAVERYYADEDKYPTSLICDNLNGNSGVLRCEYGLSAPPGIKIEIGNYTCDGKTTYIIKVFTRSLISITGSNGVVWTIGSECENPQKVHCSIREISGCDEQPPPP